MKKKTSTLAQGMSKATLVVIVGSKIISSTARFGGGGGWEGLGTDTPFLLAQL
jgi:hypothetical protein